MKRDIIVSGLENLGKKVSDNSSSILLGLGIVLFGTTVVLAVKETPDAKEAMSEKRCELVESDKVDRPEIEKAKVLAAGARAYSPAILTGGAAIFCFVFAHKINLDRQAALIGAYTIADKALITYKDEVRKQLGTKKTEEINDAVAQRQLDDNPVKQEIIILNEDQQLCMDSVSGRYFKSTIQDIREAEYQINKEMVTGFQSVVYLDDLYEALKLPGTVAGEIMGWDLQRGDRLEIKLRSGTATDGRPCWVLDYDVRPLFDAGDYI